MCLEALADPETLIVPEAERLHYSQIHLHTKYIAVRIYFSYRAEGHSAIGASEEGGWPVLVSGSSVRRWANDFVRSYMNDLQRTPKPECTFSIYMKGGFARWLLHDEGLERKARKWIAKNSEKKAEANMGVASFQRFLVGVYDPATQSFTERGLLTDILEARGKTGLSPETARIYLHKMGFSWSGRARRVARVGCFRGGAVPASASLAVPLALPLHNVLLCVNEKIIIDSHADF